MTRDGYMMLGRICRVCGMPITALWDPVGKAPSLWLSPPMSDDLSTQCPYGGRHGTVTSNEELLVAGLFTPETVQETAMQLPGIAIALIEHVHHLASAEVRRHAA